MSEGGARRSSAVRLKLKFSAFGNAVSLFPKEKYPAAQRRGGRERGNSQFLFIRGAPRTSEGALFGHHPFAVFVPPLTHFECPARLTN